MLKKVGLFALLCILLFVLIYLVNPGLIHKLSEIMAPITELTFLGDVSIWLIIEIIGVIIVTYIISKVVSFGLGKVFERTPFPEKIENAIVTLSKIVIWIIGFFVILGVGGIDLTALIVGVGAFSIAISFATKDIIQNLVSGIILHADRSFKIGDSIKVRNHGGVVKKISIRSTTLKEDDGDYVIIPNSILVTNPVKKYRKGRKFSKK